MNPYPYYEDPEDEEFFEAALEENAEYFDRLYREWYSYYEDPEDEEFFEAALEEDAEYFDRLYGEWYPYHESLDDPIDGVQCDYDYSMEM